MPPSPSQKQHSRINISELKARIAKKLGYDRSLRYFNCLNMFLSQKLRKAEFDKLCLLAIGRENLPLHNLLIRSILKNACSGQVPPPPHKVPKSITVISKVSPKAEDGPSPTQSPVLTPLIRANGNVLPISPRKIRSSVRDKRLKEQSGPLVYNGKTNPSDPLVNDNEAAGKGSMENGYWNPSDMQKPMRFHQGLAKQPENDQKTSAVPPAKRTRVSMSPPDCTVPEHSECSVDDPVVEDEQATDHTSLVNSKRSPLLAPLGVSSCSASMGRARRSLRLSSSSSYANSVDCCELSDTESLKKRMEKIASIMGLDGVSMDSANLLNNGLDMYLKRLITTCVDLYKVSHLGNPDNGLLPGHNVYKQSSDDAREVFSEPKPPGQISLLHFKVAMGLKPQQLGEDWPLLLEKICLHSSEE